MVGLSALGACLRYTKMDVSNAACARTISDAAAQNLPSHVRGSMVVAMMRAVVVMVAVVFRHRRKHHNLLISAPLGFSFPYLLRSMRTLVAVLLSAPHGCHRCPAQCPSELLPKPR